MVFVSTNCSTSTWSQETGHLSMNSLMCSLASAKVLLLADKNFTVMIRPSRETLRETKRLGDDSDLMALDTLASKSVVSSVLPPEDIQLLRGKM